jgi:hypothetical protein
MATIKINGSEMPEPFSFQWDIEDLDSENSGRTADGKMSRDRIAVKVKLSVKWVQLDSSKISKILNAVKDKFFTVTYPDALLGTVTTKTFYVGSRSAPMYTNKDGKPIWESIEMNFTEQ